MERLPKRWIVGLFIVAMLSILIWYVGPLVSIAEVRILDSVLTRSILIVLIVAAWGTLEVYSRWRVQQKSRALISGLQTAEASASAEEAQSLKKRFHDAMEALKHTRFGGKSGTSALYELPWYIFIGAPGSGKTTTLLNSGLRFPLAAPGESAAALSGIGGTKNCDWWFTDHAVLIDTAGRYTTQDSNAAVDQSAWMTFLGLLKRFRPRQPINGILATLSVQDLLTFTPLERSAYAQTIRHRVEELQRQLGLQLPVYVLVTKADLIPGFNEFFATFDADQRAQVWGVTLRMDLSTRVSEPAAAGFNREFPSLTAKLSDMLFQRLQEERDAERRAAIYPFPQQVAALQPLLSDFLDGAFGASRLQTNNSLVRGIYLTSGTQQGAPIDRLLTSLSKSLHLSGGRTRLTPSTGASKAYFITRLLQEVIFPEAALASFSEQRENRSRRFAWATTGLVLILSVVLAGAMTRSFFLNREGLRLSNSAAAQAQSALASVGLVSGNDLQELVSALDLIGAIAPLVNDPVDAPPLAMRFGIYQGYSVEERVNQRYRLALQQGLLPRIAADIEKVMLAPGSRPEESYAALKTYLMLYEPKHLDPAWFVSSVLKLWGSSHSAKTVEAGSRHLEALARLSDLQVARYHTQDTALVENARKRIAALTIVDRANVALHTMAIAHAPQLRLTEMAGPDATSLFERASGESLAAPISAVFTLEGYRYAVRGRLRDLAQSLLSEEDWVAGQHGGSGRASIDDIVSRVQVRYFSDFKAYWDNLLGDIRLRKLVSMKDALATAQLLSLPESPLRKLVIAIDGETRLSSAESGQKAVVKGGDGASQQIKAKEVVTSAGVKTKMDADLQVREGDLDQHFARLRRLRGDAKSSELDAAAQAFAEISSELASIQGKGAVGGLRETPVGLVNAKAKASRFIPPVGSALLTLAEFGEREVAGGARNEIKAGVANAAANCARSIAGRYPFAKRSNEDIGVQDFTSIFKQAGELDTFYANNLAAIVDRSGPVWRFRAMGDGTAPVSQYTLQQFQNAEAIRMAFLAGGPSPAVVADITLLQSDGGAETQFDYDGTIHKLKVGGPSARIAWPARPGAKLLRGSQQIASAEGPWALFRLIDKGSQEAGSGGDKVRVSYPAPSGGKITIEVRAGSSAFNPFRLRELETFSCPRE